MGTPTPILFHSYGWKIHRVRRVFSHGLEITRAREIRLGELSPGTKMIRAYRLGAPV
jgi:hypothetical protein